MKLLYILDVPHRKAIEFNFNYQWYFVLRNGAIIG